MTLPILHRATVLVLNRHWLAIDATSPADAFTRLAAGGARALWIDADRMQPLDWAEWIGLPVADGEPSVGTPGGRVRLPTVIVLKRYDRVPMVRPAFGFRGIWERDGGRCQYTGRTLRPGEANIDHVLPRSRGGGDHWENCVLADRRVNSRKGARTPEEAGLALLKPPRAPQPVPSTLRIRNVWEVGDWSHFMNPTT